MNLLVIVFLLYEFRIARACNGYTLKFTNVKNCVDNPVIKLPGKGFGVTLDKDCNIYSNGCVEITKAFKTAKGTYTITKPPLPVIPGDVDFCKFSEIIKSTPDLSKAVEMLGVPTKCPVATKKICGGLDNKFSILKYKNQLGMAAGNTNIKMEIEHDVGKSCWEISYVLSKARKG